MDRFAIFAGIIAIIVAIKPYAARDLAQSYPLGAIVAGLLLGYAALLRVFNEKWAPRDPADPPLISGWIPYLGVAPEFGAKGDVFLAECAKVHGPVFTLLLAGRKLTYVVDSNLLSGIVRAQDSWGFVPVGVEVGELVAGIPAKASLAVEDDAHRLLAKFLLGDTATLTKRFAERLDEFLSNELGQTTEETGEMDLYAFATRAVFTAGLTALFGKALPLANSPAKVKENQRRFDDFDSAFPLFAGGLPDWIIPSAAKKARKELIRLMNPSRRLQFGSSFLDGVPGISGTSPPDLPTELSNLDKDLPSPYYIFRHLNFLKSPIVDMAPELIGRFDILLLWAAQGNTGPAAYWTLRNVLRVAQHGSEWLISLQSEVDAAFASGVYDPDVATPVLDACVTESLRLSTSIFVIRQAIPTVDGQSRVVIPGTSFSLPVGSRLVMPARAAMHLNPDLYGGDAAPPESFDPMRHIAAGQIATNKRFLAFGAGYSMCPGRKFATNEIRCLVATILKRCDASIVEEGGEGFVKGRSGFGVQWPEKAARVVLRRRS